LQWSTISSAVESRCTSRGSAPSGIRTDSGKAQIYTSCGSRTCTRTKSLPRSLIVLMPLRTLPAAPSHRRGPAPRPPGTLDRGDSGFPGGWTPRPPC
jgi:hypothetical protein